MSLRSFLPSMRASISPALLSRTISGDIPILSLKSMASLPPWKIGRASTPGLILGNICSMADLSILRGCAWSQRLERIEDRSFPPGAGKARGSRFHGRGALPTPALEGRANTEAFDFDRMRARESGSLTEKILLEANALLAGVRSPPLRGVDHPTARWPSGESPEMTGNAVLSEGRTLCVRVAGPHECRGIAFQPDAEARGRWPTGHMPRSSPCPPCGRAEPPFSMGSQGPSKSICAAAVRLAFFWKDTGPASPR